VSPPVRRPKRRTQATSDSRAEATAPEFFIDRSLGRKHLAEALEELGLTTHTMASVYGERIAQELEDERWLADVGQHDWIVLMKDDAIRRRPSERDVLEAANVRAFCLTNAQLRASCARPRSPVPTSTGSMTVTSSRYGPRVTWSCFESVGACRLFVVSNCPRAVRLS
jgi:hypothetical protein